MFSAKSLPCRAVLRVGLVAIALLSSAIMAQAATQTIQVAGDGTLTASTLSNTVSNELSLTPGITGFNFSGSTGSYSSVKSGKDFYYAAYLIQISDAVAQSITTSLTNTSGVTDLSQRIYGYNGAFLGDALAGPSIVQVWSQNISLAGANISVVAPTQLSAGSYVLELRGKNMGNFGGSISFSTVSPVPEPQQAALLLAGICMMGFVMARRKRD